MYNNKCDGCELAEIKNKIISLDNKQTEPQLKKTQKNLANERQILIFIVITLIVGVIVLLAYLMKKNKK